MPQFLRRLVPAMVLAAVATPAMAVPSASSVYLDTASLTGTGCPSGSVGSSVSADRTAATFIFDTFVTAIGGPASLACQASLGLHIPAGDQAFSATVELRGYVQLSDGTTSAVTIGRTFDATPDGSGGAAFTGPVAKDYLYAQTSDFSTSLGLETTVTYRLDITDALGGAGSAQMTVDSLDFRLAPLPEPGTLVLSLSAFAGIAALRRRHAGRG